MNHSYRNNVGENRVLPIVCNAHDFHHIKKYVFKQVLPLRRAPNERPYKFTLKFAKRKGTHFRVPFSMERMITL